MMYFNNQNQIKKRYPKISIKLNNNNNNNNKKQNNNRIKN